MISHNKLSRCANAAAWLLENYGDLDRLCYSASTGLGTKYPHLYMQYSLFLIGAAAVNVQFAAHQRTESQWHFI